MSVYEFLSVDIDTDIVAQTSISTSYRVAKSVVLDHHTRYRRFLTSISTSNVDIDVISGVAKSVVLDHRTRYRRFLTSISKKNVDIDVFVMTISNENFDIGLIISISGTISCRNPGHEALKLCVAGKWRRWPPLNSN